MPEKKLLTIGKKTFDYSWISVGRTIKASDIYFSAFKTKKNSNSEIVPVIVGAVIILIRVNFSFKRRLVGDPNPVINWLKRRLITKRYILSHLGYTELSDFLEVALEPILGDKKKELKAKENIDLILEKLLEKMTPEELVESLQKQLLSTDGQKTTSTTDSAPSS